MKAHVIFALFTVLITCNAIELTTDKEILDRFVLELGKYLGENDFDPVHIPIAQQGIRGLKHLTCTNINVTGLSQDKLDATRLLNSYSAKHDIKNSRIILSIPQKVEEMTFDCDFLFEFSRYYILSGSIKGSVGSIQFPAVLTFNFMSGPFATLDIPAPFSIRNIKWDIYQSNGNTANLMKIPLIKLLLKPSLDLEISKLLEAKGKDIMESTIKCMSENFQPQIYCLRQ